MDALKRDPNIQQWQRERETETPKILFKVVCRCSYSYFGGWCCCFYGRVAIQ